MMFRLRTTTPEILSWISASGTNSSCIFNDGITSLLSYLWRWVQSPGGEGITLARARETLVVKLPK